MWDKTGEEINYLWGMSAEAERLLHDYVRRELVSNLTMFHLLRPIYDVNVFSLLSRDLVAVPATHSCAQLKPWCCRCAKCLYVWMSYVAWLPPETVAACFDTNLFSIPGNRPLLRKMLGLESYKPTDCVGTVSEARLAFAMCRARGVHGVIADDIDLVDFLAEGSRDARPLRACQPARTYLPPAPRHADGRHVPRQRRSGPNLRVGSTERAVLLGPCRVHPSRIRAESEFRLSVTTRPGWPRSACAATARHVTDADSGG